MPPLTTGPRDWPIRSAAWWCVASAFTVSVLVGCFAGSGSGEDAAAELSSAPAPTASRAPERPPSTPEPPSSTPEPAVTAVDAAGAVIATVTAPPVEVFASPGAASRERTIAPQDVVSLPGQIPLTFLVADQRDDWVLVHLPVRPNGTTGWVRASDVVLSSTDFRVEVQLGEHRLLLHRGADVVMDVPVGVGRAEVPTPGGVYYLKELLEPPEDGGVYGAYAYGLSGYSPVLEEFAGGEGVIGLHGTNQPELVGNDVSHGCIRMRDEDITRLVEEFGLPLGTPVEILA